MPYFWTDLSDWLTLQYVGSAARGWDREVVRGSIDDGAFSVWYFHEGTLVAALSAGRPEDLMDARRLIAARTPQDAVESAIADLSVDLATL